MLEHLSSQSVGEVCGRKMVSRTVCTYHKKVTNCMYRKWLRAAPLLIIIILVEALESSLPGPMVGLRRAGCLRDRGQI